MALDKKDMTQIETLMVKTVCDALEQIVLPRLDGIEKDIGGLKEDVGGLKEDVAELNMTTERIERKLDIEIERNDIQSVQIEKHDKRLTKLEFKKAN